MSKLNVFMAMAACCGFLSACGNVGGNDNQSQPPPPINTTSVITPNQCAQEVQPPPRLHGHGQGRCSNDNVRRYNWALGSGDVADGCRQGEIAACDSICGMVCLETSNFPDSYDIAWYSWSWQSQSPYSFSGYGNQNVYEQSRRQDDLHDAHGRHGGAQQPDQNTSANPDGQIAQTCSIASPSCAVGTCRPIGSGDFGICSR